MMNLSEEERQKLHVSNLSLSQQMNSCAARTQTDEQMGDALRLFLQDMMTTMQSLLHRHEMMYQYQRCKVAAKSMQCPLPTINPLTGFEASMAPSYGIEIAHGTQKPRGYNFETKKLDAIDSGMRKQLNGENLGGNQLDVQTVDTLKVFLEDMEKIIRAWSDRHQLFLQGLYDSQRKDRENISSLDSIYNSALPSSSGLSYFQSVPNQGASGLAHSSQSNQGLANMDLSNNVGACMVRMQSDTALQANRVEATSEEGILSQFPGQNEIKRFERGKELDNLSVHTIPVFESSSKLHSDYPNVSGQHAQFSVSEAHSSGQPGPEEMVVEVQHNIEKVNGAPPLSNPDEETKTIEPAHVKMHGKDKDVNIQEKTNRSRTSDGAHEIVVHPSKREVFPVDSPNWLPEGWITEIRIRGSGNSAGTKDKYFFDPASNRRFRSKKEVFSFLETGKLGRYKPKLRGSPNEEIESKPVEPPQENKSKNKSRSRKKKNQSQSQSQTNQPLLPALCVSTVPPTSVTASAGSQAFPPPGIFSSFFVPYRVGQSSDWLVYEGISDKPRKHYPKRAKRKAADEGKKPLNPVYVDESLQSSEAVQQLTMQQPTVQQPTMQHLTVQQASISEAS